MNLNDPVDVSMSLTLGGFGLALCLGTTFVTAVFGAIFLGAAAAAMFAVALHRVRRSIASDEAPALSRWHHRVPGVRSLGPVARRAELLRWNGKHDQATRLSIAVTSTEDYTLRYESEKEARK